MVVKQSAPWSYSRTVFTQIILRVSFIVSISDADMASGVAPVINIVEFLIKKTFEMLKLEEKLAIKKRGPDRPNINIIQQTKDRGKTYNRTFSRAWYEKKKCLCGCSKRNTVFCCKNLNCIPDFIPNSNRAVIEKLAHMRSGPSSCINDRRSASLIVDFS